MLLKIFPQNVRRGLLDRTIPPNLCGADGSGGYLGVVTSPKSINFRPLHLCANHSCPLCVDPHGDETEATSDNNSIRDPNGGNCYLYAVSRQESAQPRATGHLRQQQHPGSQRRELLFVPSLYAVSRQESAQPRATQPIWDRDIRMTCCQS